MDFLNYIVFAGIVFLLMLPSTESLKKRIVRLERHLKKKEKGKEKIMSKMLEELKGRECTLELEDDEVKGVVVAVDEEWLKIEYTEKKEGKITEIIRLELVEKVTMKE